MWRGVNQEEREKKKGYLNSETKEVTIEAVSFVNFFDVNAAIAPDGGMQSCQTGNWKWSLATRSSHM